MGKYINGLAVLICGSRNFKFDEELVIPGGSQVLVDKLSTDIIELINKHQISDVSSSQTVIITGGDKGGDEYGKYFAQRNNYINLEIAPNWKDNGTMAMAMRNNTIINEMNYYSNKLVIAIWDGQSKGTIQNIRNAVALDFPIAIYDTSKWRWWTNAELRTL